MSHWEHHETLAGDKRRACFSTDRLYRYSLSACWPDGKGTLLWIMLNPSTADAYQNDPTVERCERRTRLYGYQRMLVANIFAYRATDPSELYRVNDPVGAANDSSIAGLAGEADQVICGWGNHGLLQGRGQAVIDLLERVDRPVSALKMTGKGQPGHPLYIGYGVTPRPIGAFC